MNNAGARYPWMTSFDGSEQCESWDIGASELHITADIPFAMQQYLDATGDEDFYLQAMEVYIETARFWHSRCIILTALPTLCSARGLMNIVALPIITSLPIAW